MNTPTLFDFASQVEPPKARRTDPVTSREAAVTASVKAGTNRALALEVLRSCPDGLTDFELAARTGVAQTSIGVRRKELVRLGLVAATDRRRPSPSGSPAIVWQATEKNATEPGDPRAHVA